jgi:serine/threonine protein kinase/dipeptidyl aminopeptidase/acylaminoacyl peptidase
VNVVNWHNVKDIFNSALDLDPSEREVYLAEACAGDDDLRRKVEDLLSSYRSEFMEEPLVANQETGEDLPIGSLLGRYEIIRMVGRGGMGKVYLARDNQLDREVAIKVLNQKYENDKTNIQRFIREAKAASALNHPNILTIHEIGETDGSYYIVSEFIDGKTLREILREGDLGLLRILDISIQIANALTAAHSARIIHRDVKPENIVVRADGYVKVLDFGLAKLIKQHASLVGPEGEAINQNQTTEGLILGTVSYMSPEQARAETVDERTDLFSLGILIYEMITGKAPFAGNSKADTIANLIDKDPQPLSSFASGVPDELQRIVSKTLRKNRDERYQTMTRLLADLKDLKERITFESKLHRTPQMNVEEQTISSIIIEEESSLHEGTNASRDWREAPRKSRGVIITACLLAAGLLTAIVLNVVLNKWRESSSNSLQILATNPQLVKFTTTGNIRFGSISPDGRFAAYVADETDGSNGVWIKEVTSGSSLCVVPAAPNISYWGLTFSRDSSFLYYVTEDHAHPISGVLYRLPTVGGIAEKLLTHIATHPSFSPDGRQMVLKRVSPNQNELVIAESDGRNQQVWATSSSIYDFWAYSWSTNGQTIAYANSREDETGRYWYIAEMPVRGGAEKVISKQRWYRATRGMEWLPDGRSLVVVAEDPTTGLFQLWQISGDGGDQRRLTNDVNDYWRVSVTADGSALLTSLQERPGNIFVASTSDPQRARQITAGAAGYDTLAWTMDNRLVYSDLNNGIYDIWTMEADGNGKKRLTVNAGNNKFPAVSSDGRHVLFVSNRAGRFCVWRMDPDGSKPKQIGGETTGRVQCSPDSQQVFYTSDATGSWGLWKVPIEGGEPERLEDLYSYRASISPDGKLFSYTYLDEKLRRVRLAVSSFNNDAPVRIFDADVGYEVIRWVDGGNSIAYISGQHEIRSQPIAGGRPRVWLTVPDELFSFDVSRDGKQIAYISGRVTNNLILIRGFH